MGLGALSELQMQSRGANGRSQLASYPLYHPPSEAPGLAALDNDNCGLVQKNYTEHLMTRLAQTKKNKYFVLNLVKKFGTDPFCRFQEKHKNDWSE